MVDLGRRGDCREFSVEGCWEATKCKKLLIPQVDVPKEHHLLFHSALGEAEKKENVFIVCSCKWHELYFNHAEQDDFLHLE